MEEQHQNRKQQDEQQRKQDLQKQSKTQKQQQQEEKQQERQQNRQQQQEQQQNRQQQKEKQQQDQQRQFIKMTTEPVEKLLVKLAIPTIISMMVTNIYNLVDTAFVGTLGTSQSGATGIVFGFMAILQAVAFMCGQGSGSIMSRRLGAQKLDEAMEYTSTGFFLSFSIGLLMSVLTFIFMRPILVILGSTDTIAPYAKTYITYIALAAPFFTSSLTMNNLLRYEGKAKLGTVGMMSGAVVNIGLDAVLMFGLKLGIAGAGIATAVSQLFSFGILLFMFLSGKTETKIAFRYISKKAGTFFEIMATGFPSLLRQGLNSVATMLLNGCSGIYGDEAVAAMSIVSRISFFPMAVAIGIGQGFQPISSFNYGAGKKDRVRRGFWTALILEEIVLALLMIPMYGLAPQLIRLLRDDTNVVTLGIRALHLMSIGMLFVPLTMMVEMGFQSTGAKLLASLGSSLRSGLVFIPTLLLFAQIRGMDGIQEAQPVSFVVSFVICLFLCRVYLKRLEN